MSIPDFQTLMLPLLKFANDQQEHASREAADSLSQLFHLSEVEREELLPSGRQGIFDNRVYWAKTHLKHAGLLENTRRGFFKISQSGKDVLRTNPQEISMKFLKRFPQYIQFISGNGKTEIQEAEAEISSTQTPEELLEEGYQRIRQDLAQELLNRIKRCSPSFFENLVVELLVTMGYGGSRQDAGKAVGKSGDEGIDGIIKEDRLGLDTIYIQAKRWDAGAVSRPEIQKFVGALHGQQANKGIFITTSNFSVVTLDKSGTMG